MLNENGPKEKRTESRRTYKKKKKLLHAKAESTFSVCLDRFKRQTEATQLLLLKKIKKHSSQKKKKKKHDGIMIKRK